MELVTQNDNDKVCTSHEDKHFWMKHFKEFQLSHLNKSEYARQHNLVGHRFFYWCQKIEKDLSKNRVNVNQPEKSDFIEIKIASDEPRLPKQNLEVICTVDLGDDKRLYIHTESALKNTIKLLMR